MHTWFHTFRQALGARRPVRRSPSRLRVEYLNPDFPDGSLVSACRLRQHPGKPSVSDPFLPKRPRNPTGDSHNDPLHVDFGRSIKLEFHGSTVTSDAGLLAYRELDNALGLTSTAASGLLDTRTGQNTQHGLPALLRQSLYSRLAGYEDVNDAERLCLDPAMRAVVGGRARDDTAASASEMARFETETLSIKENLKHLMDLSGQWIDRVRLHRRLTKLILDLDSSVSETYGHQQVSAYNGYFGRTCYHPLFLFNQFGDLERVGWPPQLPCPGRLVGGRGACCTERRPRAWRPACWRSPCSGRRPA
jgi:hypothetical protein